MSAEVLYGVMRCLPVAPHDNMDLLVNPGPTIVVRGLNLQKHHDCSHRSTSTNFGSGLDMTIIYQFLEGAKMGSLCGSNLDKSKMAAIRSKIF